MAQNITNVSPNNNYVSGQSRNTLMSWNDTNPLLVPDFEDPNIITYGISFRLFNVSSGGSSLGSIGSFSFTYSSSPSGTITFTDAPVLLTMPSGLSAGTYFVAGSTTGTRFPITINAASILIQFNINGGTGTPPTSLSGSAGSSFTMPSSSGFSRSGYNFLGWSSNSSATSASFLANTSYIFNSSTTLFAVWTLIVYDILIDENGGSLVPDLTYSISTSNQTKTLTRPTSPVGRTFKDWRITLQPSNNISTAFTSNNFTIPANTTGNIGIRATYNVIQYTITYNLNDGTGTHDNPTSYNVDSATFLLQQGLLNRSGFSFIGWFTQLEGGVQVTTITQGTTGNLTFYARWTPNSYSVEFRNRYTDKNGQLVDAVLQSNTLLTGSDITYSQAIPLKVVEDTIRYIFIGWNTSSTATTVLTSLGIVESSNRTFYAIYEQYISSLKINQKDVNIKLGNTQVKKIFKGETLLWEDYNEI
jgi:uncharacterized repeat protein (TIGR02543 family)